jgi:hypothetical protein
MGRRDKWWDTKSDVVFKNGAYGTASDGAYEARHEARHDRRDDLESMEEYVFRRAWADVRGVAGHDRRLDDGAFEDSAFKDSEPSPFRETASRYGDDAGWDAARRRASSAEDDAFFL